MIFKDHFSGHSTAYHEFRPGYPEALFAYLAQIAPGRTLAWDCGTGNGQAAIGLTPYFDRIIATDPSREQLDRARLHPRIQYRCAGAEAPEIAPGSVDLVTVAQAAHWFDFDAFYKTVRSALRPGGIIALWCYDLCRIDPKVDPVVRRFYDGEIAPYWPPERKWVEERYASLWFPFNEIAAPALEMAADWNLDQLLGYVSTWSAVKRFEKQTQKDPVAELRQQLLEVWEIPESAKPVRWAMGLRVGISE